MGKNLYLIDGNEIIFRRATENDNFEEISELIYHTDQYIYPFWFGNVDNCKRELSKRICEDGFIFNFNNIYIAYDKTNEKIVGIIVAIDKSVNLDYDYTNLINYNDNYKFTINNYILPIINEVEEYDNTVLYLSNICINKDNRGKKIGTKLLGFFIQQMEGSSFDEFNLDCLLHNLRAKNLYHSLGFKEIKEIVGFDGTETSEVEVVSMKRKKGNFMDFPYDVTVNID